MSNQNISPIQMAHFRFALIAPVVQDTYFEASAAAYFKKVTQSPITGPDGVSIRYHYKTLAK